MPYTLNFSDPGNLNTITVPDYPPGLNSIDSSLSFVGKSYPNYGQVIDQNFLKILENFAGPLTPSAPVKGQLWYDSYTRTLKLFDGNAWKSANNIYQQTTNPADTSPVSQGDIWVDTANTLLKIRGAGEWIQVGPADANGSGFSVESLEDVANEGTFKTVLFVKVNSKIVAIYNSEDAFVPRETVVGFEGGIEKGITLPTDTVSPYILKGTADNANKLNDIDASFYLRKNDASSVGQIITGKVVYVTPPFSGQENRDGVIIRTQGENPALNYIQFFKKDNNAIISNQVKGGKILVKVKGINDTNQTDAISIEKNLIIVQGNLTATSVISASTLTGILSTAAQPNITSVGVLSSLTVTNTVVCKNFESTGTATIVDLHVTGRAVLPPLYGPGTMALYAGSTSTSVPTGWLVCNGNSVSTATYSSLWRVIGYRYGTGTAVTTGMFRLPHLAEERPLPGGAGTVSTYYIIKQD